MKILIKEGVILEVHSEIPSNFRKDESIIFGYELSSPEVQYADGWRDVLIPQYDSLKQYISNLHYDSELDKGVYDIIEIPVDNGGLPGNYTSGKILTKLQFLQRFTTSERLGIFAAAKQSPEAEMWLEMFKLAEEIDLSDASTIEGVQMLEVAGIIATGRANEILRIQL